MVSLWSLSPKSAGSVACDICAAVRADGQLGARALSPSDYLR